MPRSVWKGPFCDRGVTRLWERIAMKYGAGSQRQAIRVWSRRSTILPNFTGYKFEIYNGQSWFPIKISEPMIGHKFGEFAPTRKYPQHPEKATKAGPVKKNPVTGKK